MTKRPDPLLFLLAFRHIDAASKPARAAYERLESALFIEPVTLERTVVGDWIESELMSLHRAGKGDNTTAEILLNSAVEFADAAQG